MSENKNRTTWRQDFRVRAYEAGPDFRVRPDALCDYLQDAAANHAQALGVSAEHLVAESLTWVLSRLVVEFSDRPRWGETVSVETWPSGVQGIFATRDFLLSGSSSGVAARATTAWFLIDARRRRPARLPESVTRIQLPERPRVLVDDFGKIPPHAGVPRSSEIGAGPSAIDMNGHVNHVRQVSWITDAMEPEWHAAHELRRLQVQFRAEARLGDSLLIDRSPTNDSDLGWLHSLRNPEGVVIAQARTEWAPRPASLRH